MLNRALAFIAAALLLGGCTSVPEGIQPVRGFDLVGYLGTWHEIARLDHSFERGLTDVSATYSRLDDGGVQVLNRGYDPAKGAWKEALGKAYFMGDRDTASLKVSFFGPFYGGYHVFALDPGYRWAMVAGPSRDYLWILARASKLDDQTLDTLIQEARKAGFDTAALIFPARLHQDSFPRGQPTPVVHPSTAATPPPGDKP
jgi:apolipoprotein D and lipocalin family protein